MLLLLPLLLLPLLLLLLLLLVCKKRTALPAACLPCGKAYASQALQYWQDTGQQEGATPLHEA
jgi:hypothetical protein